MEINDIEKKNNDGYNCKLCIINKSIVYQHKGGIYNET